MRAKKVKEIKKYLKMNGIDYKSEQGKKALKMYKRNIKGV